MSILLERVYTNHRTIETWLCEPLENTKDSIEKVLQDLPDSVPPGSFSFVVTDDGLLVYIKAPRGKWKIV